MRRLVLFMALLAPVAAHAQQPQPANSQAEVAAFLARNLSQIAGENDALRAQLSDLQKQLAAAQAKPQEKAP